MSGKGDDRRPLSVDEKTFSDNWHRIFGEDADPVERQRVGEAIANKAFAAQDAKRAYYASVRSQNYEDSLRIEGLLGSSSTVEQGPLKPSGCPFESDLPRHEEDDESR